MSNDCASANCFSLFLAATQGDGAALEIFVCRRIDLVTQTLASSASAPFRRSAIEVWMAVLADVQQTLLRLCQTPRRYSPHRRTVRPYPTTGTRAHMEPCLSRMLWSSNAHTNRTQGE